LLRKRPGISSFDALNLIKRALDTGRVGHSGTLDKFAEGLLIVLVGRSTRLVPWFTGCDKIYDGTIEFGTETDTLDPEGLIIAQAPVPTESALRAVLPHFRGNISQSPPLYSAVHVDGKRAHEIARSGDTVEMKERPVVIHSLELLSFDGQTAQIRVHCSKGTYIRSLARDIALGCDSRAHLTALLRTRVAGFELSEAVDPFASSNPEKTIRDALRPIDERSFSAIKLPTIRLPADQALHITHGKPIDEAWFVNIAENKDVALMREDGLFLAVITCENGKRRYGYVAARPEDL